jgi:[acyl-carrier-protein] S-malonyltransferase
VQSLIKQGIEIIIECGPGKVLAGLNKRIDETVPTFSVNDPQNLVDALHIAKE